MLEAFIAGTSLSVFILVSISSQISILSWNSSLCVLHHEQWYKIRHFPRQSQIKDGGVFWVWCHHFCLHLTWFCHQAAPCFYWSPLWPDAQDSASNCPQWPARRIKYFEAIPPSERLQMRWRISLSHTSSLSWACCLKFCSWLLELCSGSLLGAELGWNLCFNPASDICGGSWNVFRLQRLVLKRDRKAEKTLKPIHPFNWCFDAIIWITIITYFWVS